MKEKMSSEKLLYTNKEMLIGKLDLLCKGKEIVSIGKSIICYFSLQTSEKEKRIFIFKHSVQCF